MGGLKIIPDLSIQQLNLKDTLVLILPDGNAWEKKSIKGIDKLVETLYAENKTIAAICAATSFLGQKGYLDKIKHTSNTLDYLKHVAQEYNGEKKYLSEVSISDGNIITANGTAPIEFAREIFKKTSYIVKKILKNGIWME